MGMLSASCRAQKPPVGARIDPAHPLAQSLVWAALINEGFANRLLITPGLVRSGFNPAQTLTPTGTPTVSSNRGGPCVTFADTGSYFATPSGTPASSWPTGDCTICVVRRKTDTTHRNSWLFGLAGGTAVNAIQARVPHSDGLVYWEYGGTSSPNQLTASGLTFSTSEPERWVFTAGAAGSAIYQNGIKVASQSTAITRTATAAIFRLNSRLAGSADNIDLNYFAMYATQWSDEMARWWSAEPYAAWSRPAHPSALLALSGGGVAVPSRFGLLGVG
jgi:hypothetical protein